MSDILGTNFYTKFSNVNLSSNKDYLTNAYAKTQTLENKADSVDLSTKKSSKKKKIVAASFIGATLLASGAIALKVIKHKNPVNLSELIEKSKKGLQDARLGEKFTNVMDNSVNIKDDIWNKFNEKVKNIPGLNLIDKIGSWITGVYKKGLTSALGPKYNKYVQELKNLGYKGDLPTFDKWFESVNNEMYEALHKKGERVTDNLFNKDIVKKVTSSNIADGKLSDILKKELIELPNDASVDMKKAVEELNKLKGTLLPKMRDINCGSAPTDLLTIILSTLGLGAAAVSADDKEERKSILVNLGIPLLVTLGSTTYGTMKALTGAKSLIFGLVSGQVASLGAKGIDKFILDRNPETKTDAQA